MNSEEPRPKTSLRQIGTVIAGIAGVAGSVASVVALWPIFFPLPPVATDPPPKKKDYFIGKQLKGGVGLFKIRPAFNINVTILSIGRITGQHSFGNTPDVDFTGAFCAGTDFVSTTDNNGLLFSSNENNKNLHAVREHFEKWPKFVLIGEDYNLQVDKLSIRTIEMLAYVRIDFENELGARLSRYFFVDPISQSVGPITKGNFDKGEAERAQLEAFEKNKGVVMQPFSCRVDRLEFAGGP